MKNFTVTDTHTDHRLDKFLTEMTGQTRSHIQRQIKFGQVLVNGKKARVHEFLKLNDKVEVNAECKGQSPKSKVIIAKRNAEMGGKNNKGKNLLHKIKKVLGKIPRAALALPKHLTPKVIFKCDEYLVIEKPAGLLVHETKISTEPTLVDWLTKKFPEITKVADTESLRRGDHTHRPGIVHRLDREVAGGMIGARTQSALDHLKQQFKK